MITWKPEGRKKRGLPRRTRDMSERGLRMGEWNNRRQWKSEGIAIRFKTAQYAYVIMNYVL
jgi:hypothetical protein